MKNSIEIAVLFHPPFIDRDGLNRYGPVGAAAAAVAGAVLPVCAFIRDYHQLAGMLANATPYQHAVLA